jgi:hypothetical protein
VLITPLFKESYTLWLLVISPTQFVHHLFLPFVMADYRMIAGESHDNLVKVLTTLNPHLSGHDMFASVLS